MKKIILVLGLVFSLGLVGCSIPTEEKIVYVEKETTVETPKEEKFEYNITYGGYSQVNKNLIFTYYIDANKPFTIVCNRYFYISGRSVHIYVPFPSSITPTKSRVEAYKPSFKVVEAK